MLTRWLRACLPTLVVALCLLHGACQGVGVGTRDDGDRGSPDGDEKSDAPTKDDPDANAVPDEDEQPVPIAPDVAALEVAVRAHAEPGAYRDDERWRALARAWPDHVRRAMERLPVVTGLAFSAGPSPRVLLKPLGDERVPFEVRVEVVQGRRRAGVVVNAEPLVAGTARVDRTLLHALGAAVLDDSRVRGGDIPQWVVALAGLAAGGDLEERLGVMHRDFVLGDVHALQIDPLDEDVATATAIAAFVLLSERAKPYDVRRFLRSVAGGDDANTVIARLVAESDTGWIDAARLALHARIRLRDPAPWQLLQAAETALEESGRAGLHAMLPAALPSEVDDEIRVLRARGALDEGDAEAARTELRALSGEAFRMLRDPAAAVVLRVEAEIATGGDPALARAWARRHELDFPRHRAGPRLRQLAAERGMQEDPQGWMRALRARLEREGTADMDLLQAQRYARALLLDHRAGAAESFLLGLGARATALELHNLSTAIADAQEDPSKAARARASDRIGRWLSSPRARDEQDVVDGGMASAFVLGEMLVATPNASAADRKRVVDLLARCAGPARTLHVMRVVWRADNRALLRDLATLSRRVPLDTLEQAVFDGGVAELAGRPADEVWAVVSYGLPKAWLRDHPAFLERLHDPVFRVRQRAFEVLARDELLVAPPELIGHVLEDPSPVLRRRAVEVAGRLGYRALAAESLKDPHASVRRAACRAVARSMGADAVGPLMERLRRDDDLEVRSVAAWGLLETAADNGRVLDALLALQRDGDPRLREPLERAMAKAPAASLGPALARAIRGEMRKTPPSRAALFRWMAIFQRASRIDVGFHPGSTRAEIDAMVRRIEAWARQVATSAR